MAVAKAQNEKGGIRSFHYALEAEKIHAAMLTVAKESVDRGKDMELDDVQICSVCGHTTEGEAPERCPACNQLEEVFVAIRK